MSYVPTMLSGLLLIWTFAAAVAHAAAHPELEACYQAYGQLETTAAGGKKTTVYKDQAQVAGECNDRVVNIAKKETSQVRLTELAGVIGRNSNWQSAMPVYTIAAKADASHAACTGKDPLYALDLALAAPTEHAWVAAGTAFMEACWPKLEKNLVRMLKSATGYNKDHLCRFLRSKNAVPADKKAKCAA